LEDKSILVTRFDEHLIPSTLQQLKFTASPNIVLTTPQSAIAAKIVFAVIIELKIK